VRATHDAVYVLRVIPTAMIFIPCKDGMKPQRNRERDTRARGRRPFRSTQVRLPFEIAIRIDVAR
jgi:hypothetical protein